MSTRHTARTAPPSQNAVPGELQSNHPATDETSAREAAADSESTQGLSACRLVDLIERDLQLIEELGDGTSPEADETDSGMQRLLEAVLACAETDSPSEAADIEPTTLLLEDARIARAEASRELQAEATVPELQQAARQLTDFAAELDSRAMRMIGRDEASLQSAGELLDQQQELMARLDELQRKLDELEPPQQSRSVA